MADPYSSPAPSTMQSTPSHTTTANKDYLSKLPPEILHKILILLPYPIHYPRKIKSKEWLDERLENPTRQLLKWNSNAKDCKVLDLVYQLSNDIDGEAISARDYTVHVRYINPIGFSSVFPESQISPRIAQYLKSLEEEEERIMGIELDRLPPGYLERFQNKWDLVLRCFHVELYRQVIWHIAEPILEQLRGLRIPLSDIDRYLEVVGRFESLEQVTFILDEPFDFDAKRVAHRPMHPEWVSIRRKGRDSDGKVQGQWTGEERKAEAMRKVVEFVREHVRLFGDRLTKATCKDGYFWPDAPQSFPEDIQVEILASIPPTPKLKSLSHSERPLVKAHPKTIDFCWVESIDLSWFGKPVCEGLSNDWVLPRCRRLKSLSTPPLGSDTFKWAVQEKRDLDSIVSCSTTSTADMSNQEGRPAYIEYGLVPLERIEIKEGRSRPLCDEEVNDIAIAFSQTITSLRIEGERRTWSADTTPLRHFHFGRGWVDMLAVTELHLYMQESDHRVVLDRELLAHCPNITSIKIKDRTRDYDFSEIVPCLPTYLPRLRELDLCGWSALTFDPETLSLTPGLRNLTIGTVTSNWRIAFIPPITELYRSFGILEETEEEEGVEENGERIVRPRWTWDWYLPMLEYLYLLGEFAYLFQFKMLTGCPQLWCLTLDIRTNDYNGHPRVITEADLSIAGAGETRERIVVEGVRCLSLRGNWVVDSESILSQFLVDMFPNVTDLKTQGGGNGGGVFQSLGLGSMMSIIRNNPNHKWQEVQTELEEPRRQEVLDHGLCKPEWEEENLDFETVEMLDVRVLFRDGNEAIDENFLRVLKVLDFERDVPWAVADDAPAYSPMQVPWVV
ncbi:hypothetical protein K457DRAFT_16276 [Linnemannia elongata AG-77]|uniref:F-box domain-containing protein n=1 Tax=Linnemannia elongata AG-77 TaxID=1314771 RepID=A0A197K4Y6_9FUNG|nr:hypothetical protein K457DRAFT_16276 [Linnemannia elongata AG-77]